MDWDTERRVLLEAAREDRDGYHSPRQTAPRHTAAPPPPLREGANGSPVAASPSMPSRADRRYLRKQTASRVLRLVWSRCPPRLRSAFRKWLLFVVVRLPAMTEARRGFPGPAKPIQYYKVASSYSPGPPVVEAGYTPKPLPKKSHPDIELTTYSEYGTGFGAFPPTATQYHSPYHTTSYDYYAHHNNHHQISHANYDPTDVYTPGGTPQGYSYPTAVRHQSRR
eukprot:Sspe_Gene.69541::Locus_40999_Transcript_1_1_Confidence_1.000_Length_785::g.69541::m.69541